MKGINKLNVWCTNLKIMFEYAYFLEIALSVKCTLENDHTECVPNAVCQSDGSEPKCTCSNGFYDSNFADSGGTCTPGM